MKCQVNEDEVDQIKSWFRLRVWIKKPTRRTKGKHLKKENIKFFWSFECKKTKKLKQQMVTKTANQKSDSDSYFESKKWKET